MIVIVDWIFRLWWCVIFPSRVKLWSYGRFHSRGRCQNCWFIFDLGVPPSQKTLIYVYLIISVDIYMYAMHQTLSTATLKILDIEMAFFFSCCTVICAVIEYIYIYIHHTHIYIYTHIESKWKILKISDFCWFCDFAILLFWMRGTGSDSRDSVNVDVFFSGFDMI